MDFWLVKESFTCKINIIVLIFVEKNSLSFFWKSAVAILYNSYEISNGINLLGKLVLM